MHTSCPAPRLRTHFNPDVDWLAFLVSLLVPRG